MATYTDLTINVQTIQIKETGQSGGGAKGVGSNEFMLVGTPGTAVGSLKFYAGPSSPVLAAGEDYVIFSN